MGGAAKAVQVALQDLEMEYTLVSRQKSDDSLLYEELTEEIMGSHLMIINTTPLGPFPNTEECPSLPYQWVTKRHYLYDLVYNPAETLFLKNGAANGATTQNGLKMLELQAEKAWEIWINEDNLWSV
jgi:shikimate dehydrogenase